MAKAPIDHIIKPVHKFISQEFTSGIILFIQVIIAIIWVNSPWSASYHHTWATELGISLGNFTFNQSLHIWINDGLMALFFFVIGLELKREFTSGELSSIQQAALPMMAAVGGMVVPAAIYILINLNRASIHGWGIPMATDIAFALAIVSLAGKSIPSSVKVFLSALAVADDLGAVLVIAFFYTPTITYLPLLIAGVLLLVLIAGNLLGIRGMLFYALIGIAIWAGFLFSGVHATIAGVLVAFTIPARTKIDEEEYVRDIRKNTMDFENAIPQNGSLTTSEQHQIIENIKKLSTDAETPLQKLENNLHPWVAFIIMPVFALSNAGILIGKDFFSILLNPISLGVGFGLVVGKCVGILVFTWIMVRLKFSALPEGSSWSHIFGVSILAGVGFTMSLFIAELAFSNELMISEAKYGILLASLLAGGLGYAILRRIPAK